MTGSTYFFTTGSGVLSFSAAGALAAVDVSFTAVVSETGLDVASGVVVVEEVDGVVDFVLVT
jgi:hypothetical protein